MSEELSALVDGELASAPSRLLFDRLRSDEALRARWARYHEIGDLIRNEAPELPLLGLAERVRERLQDEPAILSPQRPAAGLPHRLRWGQVAAGLALAASVAGVSVYLTDLQPSTTQADSPRMAQTPTTIPTPTQNIAPLMPVAQTAINPEPTPSLGNRWKRISQPRMESKLNRYLADHSEYATPGGMVGLIPYATLVSYDAGR